MVFVQWDFRSGLACGSGIGFLIKPKCQPGPWSHEGLIVLEDPLLKQLAVDRTPPLAVDLTTRQLECPY